MPKPQWCVIAPPTNTRAAWGARAIYSLKLHEEKYFQNGKKRKHPKSVLEASIETLWDRQEMLGDDESERKALSTWINKKGLPQLKKICLDKRVWGDSYDTPSYWDDEAGYWIQATPNGSHGYLYITAWKSVAGE